MRDFDTAKYQKNLYWATSMFGMEVTMKLFPSGHWLGDVFRVIFERDTIAATWLVNNVYREPALFHLRRKPMFKYWMNKRLVEGGYHGGIKAYNEVWNNIAIPATVLSLAIEYDTAENVGAVCETFINWLYLMAADETPATGLEFGKILHQCIRNDIRTQIEFDLTDGATFGEKEVMNINGDDKNKKTENEQDPERALDWMFGKMAGKVESPYYHHFGKEIEEESENLNVDSVIDRLLDGVIYEDKLILLTPPGEMGVLSKRLSRTPNALYQRKNTLVNQLIKRTKLPPKI